MPVEQVVTGRAFKVEFDGRRVEWAPEPKTEAQTNSIQVSKDGASASMSITIPGGKIPVDWRHLAVRVPTAGHIANLRAVKKVMLKISGLIDAELVIRVNFRRHVPGGNLLLGLMRRPSLLTLPRNGNDWLSKLLKG